MTMTLILVRHGQSVTNAAGVFTGLLDVPLSEEGRFEASRAAEQLNEAKLGAPVWFCSPLLRARQTADALCDGMVIKPDRVTEDWRLAERNYGAFTGLGKAAVLAEYGEERFHAWRRSVDGVPPPMTVKQHHDVMAGLPPEAAATLGLTESLRNVIDRVGDAYRERILPALHAAECVLIVAHGNSLRALCSVLDGLTAREVENLDIPTGQPLVYRLGSGSQPLERGGRYLDPLRASEAARAIAREGGT